MTKRILGVAVAAILVLGVAGAALAAAAPPDRAAFELDEAVLALATDPQPGVPPEGKGQELQACVKPKVDAGTDRKSAVKECAAQLGIQPGGRGKDEGRGKGKGKGMPFGLGRAGHAEVVVPKQGAEGQWETVIVDRGQVTAASADSISVQRPDGPTVTVRVVAATKVKGAATVAELTAGRQVVVVSAAGDARTVVARR